MGNQNNLEECNEKLNNLINKIEEYKKKEKIYIIDKENLQQIHKEQLKDKDNFYIIIIIIIVIILGLIGFIYDYIKTKRQLRNMRELANKMLKGELNEYSIN